ncbi:MAG: alpha/beta hydrolase [Bacteroidia bacterium]|nr:alpha/beta hydrolase [Bacteroidia bacterium]
MKRKKIWKVIRIIWISSGLLSMIWLWSNFWPRDIEDKVFQSDEKVLVQETESMLSFLSTEASDTEVIFYPGGMVNPISYAPLARKLAESGYSVHIIRMPWRMATKGYKQILDLFDLNDPEKKYVLGGHSQGAKMAAQFVYEHPSLMKGLYLLGTSHPRDIDMSEIEIPCVKLYAELDGQASVGEVMQNKELMPKGSEMIMIAGGNHSQFGNMGKLFMDDSPKIDRIEQQEIVREHLLEFLNKLEVDVVKTK